MIVCYVYIKEMFIDIICRHYRNNGANSYMLDIYERIFEYVV